MLKFTRRAVFGGALMFAAAFAAPAHAEAPTPEEATQLVESVTDRLLALIQAPGPVETKRSAFRELMLDSSDMTTIARFAIGRRWKEMNDAQREDYRSAFTNYLSRIYTSRFTDYQGETFRVDKTRPGQKDVYVITSVVRQGAEPIEVSWRVRDFSGQPKILDIEAEGVSLLVSLKNEVSGLLSQNGDDLDKMIAVLRSKA